MTEPQSVMAAYEEPYCWTCGGTGEVREQSFDDLSGYVECACVYGWCGCGCCDADDNWDWEDAS